MEAVFAANDLSASGALRVLRERGRRVPEDVAVIGLDDMLPVAEGAEPPLTTIRQDTERMGRLMARPLLRGLERGGRDESGAATTVGGAPSSIVLPTTLVRRASA